MTRDEILQEVLKAPNRNKLLMLGTGVGKSKIAIELINQIQPLGKILIVVPRLVLIQNWKDEFIKWGYEKYLPQVEFVTYVSLPKLMKNSYDVTIYDESHHISERCQQAIPYIKSNYNILLSATIKRTLRPILQRLFHDLFIYEVSLVDAIDNDILPEPRIVLIPLQLETTRPDEIYEVNPKKYHQKAVNYNQWLKGKWQYLRGNFDYGVKVRCTQRQKYQEMCDFIDNCTRKLQNNLVAGMNRIMVEQARKRKGLERLQWLAEIKSDFVKQLLRQLKNYRTLTFCYNIKQTEYLGKYCINSKNKKSAEYLQLFNDKKIKHITAAGMLNEGMNLSECKCGVFVNYHKSEIISVQRIGRLLRHSKPVIYLPYYINTVEEQIVNTMIEGYDSSLIVKATNPFNFNEYINK
jgi:superfamily II DNA or RNA helicase